MATFWAAQIALGSGSGAAFVELPASNGYSRSAVNFGTPVGGASASLSTASWTPSGAWPAVTQLGIADAASGAVLIVLACATPVTFAVGISNSIAPGRLSVTVPLPVGVSAGLSWTGSNSVTGEVGTSATAASVELGSDVVTLTPTSVLANIAAGG